MKNKFKANGCTGVPELIFHKACNWHDRAYYDMIGRKIADKGFLKRMLQACKELDDIEPMRDIYIGIARAYYVGVRVLGWRYYYLTKRYLKKRLWG